MIKLVQKNPESKLVLLCRKNASSSLPYTPKIEASGNLALEFIVFVVQFEIAECSASKVYVYAEV